MIDLIKIDLNPREGEEARKERIRERKRWILLGFITILLVGMNLGIFVINRKMDRTIDDKISRIEMIKEQINHLQKQGKNLSKQDILSLNRLESNRIFWAEKLMALGKEIHDDMAITRIEFKGSRLVIDGIARINRNQKEFDVVDYLVRRLQTDEVFSPDFRRIKFANYSRLRIKNQDIVSFEIEATLKKVQKIGKKSRNKPLLKEIG